MQRKVFEWACNSINRILLKMKKCT